MLPPSMHESRLVIAPATIPITSSYPCNISSHTSISQPPFVSCNYKLASPLSHVCPDPELKHLLLFFSLRIASRLASQYSSQLYLYQPRFIAPHLCPFLVVPVSSSCSYRMTRRQYLLRSMSLAVSYSRTMFLCTSLLRFDKCCSSSEPQMYRLESVCGRIPQFRGSFIIKLLL